jgi:hypothetical protein
MFTLSNCFINIAFRLWLNIPLGSSERTKKNLNEVGHNQLLVYVADVNLLVENINATKKTQNLY